MAAARSAAFRAKTLLPKPVPSRRAAPLTSSLCCPRSAFISANSHSLARTPLCPRRWELEVKRTTTPLSLLPPHPPALCCELPTRIASTGGIRRSS